MNGFQAIHEELEALGAHVVGVSADTHAANGGFAEKHDIAFPLLSDWPKYETIDAFDVRREGQPLAMRTTYIFDTDGVVIAIVDDPRDMQAHPDGALAAVKALAWK